MKKIELAVINTVPLIFFFFLVFHLFVFRLTDTVGSIHDGAGNYSIGVKCSWLIDARDHSPLRLTDTRKPPTIRLHLEEFATECGWDHLYVYDGDSVESALLAVFRFVYFLLLFFFCCLYCY